LSGFVPSDVSRVEFGEGEWPSMTAPRPPAHRRRLLAAAGLSGGLYEASPTVITTNGRLMAAT
jgi:hypothetical protein